MRSLKEKIKDAVNFFVRIIVWLCFCAVWKARVFGANNIPKGGCLFLSNHQSYFDPMLIGSYYYRRNYYLLRTTLQSFIFKILMLPFKLVYIRRGESDIMAIRRAIEVLRKGETLLLFPEGTRTRSGKIGSIRRGFTLIAKKSEALVVPVLIQGGFECWPKGQLLPKPGRLSITFSPPFKCAPNMKDSEIVRRMTTAWEAAGGTMV